MRQILLGILPFMLAGCTGVCNYRHVSSDNDGKIYVHRVSGVNACGAGAVFYIDDQNILKLGTKQYAEIPVSAGPHKISVKGDQTVQKDEIHIVVVPHENLYYRIEPNPQRLGPTLLFPIVDVMSVKTFLLIESTRKCYEDIDSGYHKKNITITEK